MLLYPGIGGKYSMLIVGGIVMEQQFCPQCGKAVAEGAAFCNHCGASIVPISQPAVAPVAPTPAAPPRFDTSQPQYVAVMEMNYPKASNGSRFIASVVDWFVSVVALLPGAILLGSGTLGSEVGAVLMLIGGCWAVFYSFCKDGFGVGQSYGKKMNGLMVVSLANNQPCSKGKSALRALGFCIPYIGGMIEMIMVLATEKGRRLGDKFAGTQVIEVRQYQRLQ